MPVLRQVIPAVTFFPASRRDFFLFHFPLDIIGSEWMSNYPATRSPSSKHYRAHAAAAAVHFKFDKFDSYSEINSLRLRLGGPHARGLVAWARLGLQLSGRRRRASGFKYKAAVKFDHPLVLPARLCGAAEGNHAHCYIRKVCSLLLVRAEYIGRAPGRGPEGMGNCPSCTAASAAALLAHWQGQPECVMGRTGKLAGVTCY